MKTFFTHDPAPSDPTISRLRADAQSYDPDPPSGVRSRFAQDLAALEMQPGPRQWKGALITAGSVLACIIVAMIVFREKPQPTPIALPMPKNVRPTSPNTVYAANPLLLAERFLENPMQSELNNLVSDLGRTTQTISTILPSPKKNKPATQPPAKALGA